QAEEPVKKKPLEPVSAPPAPSPQNLTVDSLPGVWREVLKQVGRMFASEVERAGLPAISGPNTLVLRFPPQYNQQREHCQEPSRLARLEEVLRAVSGQPWSIRVESGDGAAPAVSGDATQDTGVRYRRQRGEVEEPLV